MDFLIYLINLNNREERLLSSLKEIRKVNLTNLVMRKEVL